MLDSILNCYDYGDKSCIAETADFFLTPARVALDYKTVKYSSQHKFFSSADHKTASLFMRIILGALAVLMLPVTVIAGIVKLLDGKNREVHRYNREQIDESEKEKQLLKDGAEKCAICLEIFKDKAKEAKFLTCFHAFHPACVDPWLNSHNNCPECRVVQPREF